MTFPIVAFVAILMISLAPTLAFGMSAEEEAAVGALNDYDPSAATFSSAQFSTQQTPVLKEVQLLVDISGSIDADEFAVQRIGYANAFNDTEVKDAVELSCPNQAADGVAVQFIYWSGDAEQSIEVDWTHITTAAESEAFGVAINNSLPRPFSGLTAIGSAIDFGAPLFAGNGFTSADQIIDVSGDGITNDPNNPGSGLDNTPGARDAALAGGIDRINGLVISPNVALTAYYTANVTGGAGSFVDTIADLTDQSAFTDAIVDKLAEELDCPDCGNGIIDPGEDCDPPNTANCDSECKFRPVGGAVLPIDNTALLIAGMSANMVFLAPIVAGVAGVGAYYIITRMHKE